MNEWTVLWKFCQHHAGPIVRAFDKHKGAIVRVAIAPFAFSAWLACRDGRLVPFWSYRRNPPR